ncbi:MAG: hypothetical protein VZT48_05130 [Bulleidia sp.]|nr:hypothetical protein [Bulleidia sp.]
MTIAALIDMGLTPEQAEAVQAKINAEKKFADCPRLGYTMDEVVYITGIPRKRLQACVDEGLLKPINIMSNGKMKKQIFDLNQVSQFLEDMRGEVIGTQEDLECTKDNIQRKRQYGRRR